MIKDYSILNLWLLHADEHYIAGRIVGLKSVYVTQSCANTWLGFEQLIKTLILQGVIDQSTKPISAEDLNRTAKNINHGFDRLLDDLHKIHPEAILGAAKERLEQVRNYYQSRYPNSNPGKLNLNLGPLDELYFKLRDLVYPQVGKSLIETIYIRRRAGAKQDLGDDVAYERNPYFRPRPFAATEAYDPITQFMYTIPGYPE